MYTCAHCSTRLFEPSAKFASGTGWPAFSRSLTSGVAEKTDWRLREGGTWLGLRRELVCRGCGGHLGHVFRRENWDNGTGERYCINGACLALVVQH